MTALSTRQRHAVRASQGRALPRTPSSSKEHTRLPGKGNSNSHGARPVHLITTMIKWIWASRLSIKNSLSPHPPGSSVALTVRAVIAMLQCMRRGPLSRSLIESFPPFPRIHSTRCALHHAELTVLYRGTSLTRNQPPLGPYSRTLPRPQRWS